MPFFHFSEKVGQLDLDPNLGVNRKLFHAISDRNTGPWGRWVARKADADGWLSREVGG